MLSSFTVVLPDSTATDIDQHLSNLVSGVAPSASIQMNHGGQLNGNSTANNNNNANTNVITSGGNNQTSISSTATVNGLGIPRYLANANNNNNNNGEYTVHTSQNGPRSLSDSSQAESPVQDDLLSSNTPNLGNTQNTQQNFSTLVVNHGGGGGSGGGGVINSGGGGVGGYGSTGVTASSSGGGGGGGGGACNGSLYPVLPASLLYSQLYTAANQTHGFHSHSLQSHGGSNNGLIGTGNSNGNGVGGIGNGSVHELQSVMEHISTVGVNVGVNISGGVVGNNGGGGIGAIHVNGSGSGAGLGNIGNIGVHRHQNLLMAGTTDLSHHVGVHGTNCGASVRANEDRQVVAAMAAGQRTPSHHAENGNSVWRPY